jgi:hypothetical protein
MKELIETVDRQIDTLQDEYKRKVRAFGRPLVQREFNRIHAEHPNVHRIHFSCGGHQIEFDIPRGTKKNDYARRFPPYLDDLHDLCLYFDYAGLDDIVPKTDEAGVVHGEYYLIAPDHSGEQITWWCADCKGYTHYLDDAGVYTLADLERRDLIYQIQRGHVIAMPVAEVQQRMRPVLPFEHFDMDRQSFEGDSVIEPYIGVVPGEVVEILEGES